MIKRKKEILTLSNQNTGTVVINTLPSILVIVP